MVVLNILGHIGKNSMKKTILSDEEIRELVEKVNQKNILGNQTEYTPYGVLNGRKPDFEVQYSSISDEKKLFVGMRSNFKYSDEMDKIWIILPEFLDENSNVITNMTARICTNGNAYMWIVNDNNRDFHKIKLKLGTEGYITFGNDIFARVIVTKIFF